MAALTNIASSDNMVFAAPEPGQLVEVRRRQWVVADVKASAPDNGYGEPQHCLTLSSIDEDALA